MSRARATKRGHEPVLRTSSPSGSGRSGRRNKSGRPRRSPVSAVVVLLVIALLSFGLLGWIVFFRSQTSIAAGTPVTVTIVDGASSTEIARVLAASGVVENKNMFLYYVRKMDAGGKLKAGTYLLAARMPYDDVVEKLETGPAQVETVKVTIPEGWRIHQVAARIEETLGIPAEEFETLASTGAEQFSARHPYLVGAYGGSLEGFLFPKTYVFERSITATEVVETMLTQFDREIASIDVALAESRGYTLSEVVVMASIIERETRLDEERPLVASVIYNRLDRGWKLQMCSTVQILIDEENKLRLSANDLKIESPYNTYLNAGLPPGPIACPGLESLKAAANPAATDYLYYVLTGKDGSQTFATNEKDFLAAKRKSLEVFGE
jgi:UPF0755 protein